MAVHPLLPVPAPGNPVGGTRARPNGEESNRDKAANHVPHAGENFFRDLVEHSEDLLCTHDLQGRLLWINPAPARRLGYQVEEMLHIPMRQFVAPEFRDQFDEYLGRVQRDGVAKGLMAVVTRTGERRIWEYHNTLRSEGLPAPVVRGVAHDVTERMQAEDALRKSAERFRVALKNSPITVFNQDRQLRYTWIHNPTLAWAKPEWLGKTDADVLDPEDASRLTVIKRRVLETGAGARGEIYLTREGKKYCFDLTVEPLLDSTRSVAGITCACMDVTELHQKTQRLQMLLEMNHALAPKLELKDLLPAVSACVRGVITQDFASVALYDAESQVMRTFALDFPLAQELIEGAEIVPVTTSLPGQAVLSRETRFFHRADIAKANYALASRMLESGIRSLCCVPMKTPRGPLGTLNIGSRQEHAFGGAEMDLIRQVAEQVAMALENARAYQEIGQLKDKLAVEKDYLESAIAAEFNLEEIIGESRALKQVLGHARTVAPSDATVLLLGETGTGKELVARAIHRMSTRSRNSFIKMNCAAIPTGLLESELFGHEKGAFTGAISRKVGRLELADKGTLFLDEIGDVPLELQPKLLRVLQDQEFERLGSTRTSRVNARLIAATNRDLARDVAERHFREDLFYRLNVFPIHLPALRERREDIPALAQYFVRKYAARISKRIDTIPEPTMKALTEWDWPGNIRELENFMERSVILSPGCVLQVPVGELRPTYESKDRTLESAEREYILRTLHETRGVIAGPKGAAARLGLKRTTLQSKMRRLQISRQEYQP